LDDAIYSLESHRYSLAAFSCQQALEKILKAAIIKLKEDYLTDGQSPSRSIFLASGLPKPFGRGGHGRRLSATPLLTV
jgi:hypothetical protein